MEDLTDAELHFDTDSEDLNDEKEFALHDQSNITPEGRDSDKEEPAPGASDEERISTKEDFIKLSSILHALKTTVEYPDDIVKYNEVRATIKTQTSASSSLNIPPQGLSSPLQSATTMNGTLRMKYGKAS